jgi:hypothetical protein
VSTLHIQLTHALANVSNERIVRIGCVLLHERNNLLAFLCAFIVEVEIHNLYSAFQCGVFSSGMRGLHTCSPCAKFTDDITASPMIVATITFAERPDAASR